MRYCILSIPRTGSTWLNSGIGYCFSNLENYINLNNVPTVMPEKAVAFDSVTKTVVQKTTKCYKGKLIKTMSGINPKCPKGYKVKV